MKLPIITMALILLLTMNTVSILEMESIDPSNWLYGFISMNILLAIWWNSKATRVVLSIFGVGLLISVALGLVEAGNDSSRAFFNGGAFGCLTGILLALRIYWPRSAKYAAMAAEHDGYAKLSAWFTNKANN